MKIVQTKINSFIKNLPSNLKAILLYGIDAGLISYLSNKIKLSFLGTSFENYNIVNIDASELKKEPEKLFDVIYSYSMFTINPKKIVIISNCSSYLTSVIKAALENIEPNILLLLLAEELSNNNSLRTWAEKSDIVASISCFHDSIDTLKHYISTLLSKYQYTITPEALNWISLNLGNDRMITKQELIKLMLYKGENKKITFNDVINVISNNSDLAINDIIFDITLGNQVKVYNKLKQFLLNFPSIIIIRALNNTFKRLLLAKQLQNEKLSIDEIASILKPPVLFFQLNHFKSQLDLWDINNINKFLKKLIYLELEIKKNPNLDFVLLNKFTLDIALLFNKK